MKKNKSISVVIVPPQKEPFIKTVRYTLESLQKIVGGNIEPAYDDRLPGLLILCNDEGKLNSLRFNRTIRQGDFGDYIFGTFFVCAMDGEDFCSLRQEEAEKVIKRFSLRKAVR